MEHSIICGICKKTILFSFYERSYRHTDGMCSTNIHKCKDNFLGVKFDFNDYSINSVFIIVNNYKFIAFKDKIVFEIPSSRNKEKKSIDFSFDLSECNFPEINDKLQSISSNLIFV